MRALEKGPEHSHSLVHLFLASQLHVPGLGNKDSCLSLFKGNRPKMFFLSLYVCNPQEKAGFHTRSILVLEGSLSFIAGPESAMIRVKL